jgi:nicotinate-nucleotide adenylyltransferase
LKIARTALLQLGLDQVWLMVSPGNPLKDPACMAPLDVRLASAQSLSPDPGIIATAIEADLGTVYSADTLKRLRILFPEAHFVWLLGADNFVQLPQWRDWRWIVDHVPMAIFPRPGATSAARHGAVAQEFAAARLGPAAALQLAQTKAPAWLFLPMRADPISSTAIRARIKPISLAPLSSGD